MARRKSSTKLFPVTPASDNESLVRAFSTITNNSKSLLLGDESNKVHGLYGAGEIQHVESLIITSAGGILGQADCGQYAELTSNRTDSLALLAILKSQVEASTA